MTSFNPTVVITTYNREQKLRRCISSVLRQTYQHFQVVVADDCSEDGTKDFMIEITKEYDNVTYLRQNENVGFHANYENAMDHVRAETMLDDNSWVISLCDDDFWKPRLLEHAANAYKKYPDANLIAPAYTAYIEGEDSKKFGPYFQTYTKVSEQNELHRLGAYGCPVGPGCFVKIGVLETIGKHDPMAKLHGLRYAIWDTYIHMMSLIIGNVVYLPYNGVMFEVNNDSEGKKDKLQTIKHQIELMNDLHDMYQNKYNEEYPRKFTYSYYRALYNFCKHHAMLIMNSPKDSKEMIADIIRSVDMWGAVYDTMSEYDPGLSK